MRRQLAGVPDTLNRLTIVAVAVAMPMSAGSIAAADRPDLTGDDRDRVQAITELTSDFSRPETFEANQGGAGTCRGPVDGNTFSYPAANIGFEGRERFNLGNAIFRKLWVSSPASTQASDGLGPLFNARACQSCHLKNGRGHPPEGDSDATSFLIRLARTEPEKTALSDRSIRSFPDPVYGHQIQDRAVPGFQAEGRISIVYSESPVVLGDGTTVSLRKPDYGITDMRFGPLAEDTTLSPRIAPPMIGLGLIEAIHPTDISARADPDDLDGDGISGRVSMLRDPLTGRTSIGRFGWKASQSTLKAQNAAAFMNDLGISTPLHPAPAGDCTDRQTACLSLPNGVQQQLGETEAPDPILDLVTFYSAHLAVPRRRDVNDPQVLHGKSLFYGAGCTDCHRPKFVTRRDIADTTLAFQLIWPYSDFLLHDMGPSLADGQAVGDADGREWRTPPLWGIGLTRTVGGHSFFLHDGRARNLTEAILWHGGEARRARDRFAAMAADDRQALIAFLASL